MRIGIYDELQMETSPEPVGLSQPRLNVVVEMLRNRQAEDLTKPGCMGVLDDADTDGAISLGGANLEIPNTASIEMRVHKDTRPGVQIASDHPLPDGTCVWIPCDAVAHAHQVIAAVTEAGGS